MRALFDTEVKDGWVALPPDPGYPVFDGVDVVRHGRSYPAPGDAIAVVERCGNCGGQGQGVGSSTAHAFINGRLRAVGAGGQMITTAVCHVCDGKGLVRTGFVQVVETLPLKHIAYTPHEDETVMFVDGDHCWIDDERFRLNITLPNAVPGGVALRVEPWCETCGSEGHVTQVCKFDPACPLPGVHIHWSYCPTCAPTPVTRTDGGTGPLGEIGDET